MGKGTAIILLTLSSLLLCAHSNNDDLDGGSSDPFDDEFGSASRGKGTLFESGAARINLITDSIDFTAEHLLLMTTPSISSDSENIVLQDGSTDSSTSATDSSTSATDSSTTAATDPSTTAATDPSTTVATDPSTTAATTTSKSSSGYESDYNIRVAVPIYDHLRYHSRHEKGLIRPYITRPSAYYSRETYEHSYSDEAPPYNKNDEHDRPYVDRQPAYFSRGKYEQIPSQKVSRYNNDGVHGRLYVDKQPVYDSQEANAPNRGRQFYTYSDRRERLTNRLDDTYASIRYGNQHY